MKKILSLLIGFLIAVITTAQHQLVKLWESDSVFKVPESVLYDPVDNILYVSNIDGKDPWAKDGKGSIGKLTADGRIIKAEWATGLNAPKGMALSARRYLHVADLNEVTVIDILTGEIMERMEIKGAEGLNDITIDKGVMYISDSKTKKVFRYANGKSEVFLENLKGPNGVLRSGESLYLLDAGSLYRVDADKKLNFIVDGLEGGSDGIENVTGNEFIVSSWSGLMWYINADGTKQLLIDTRNEKKNTADIGYDPVKRIVYVPTFWRNSVVAYQVK